MAALGFLVIAVLVILCIVLPIVAIVRTGRIRHLERRLEGVEAALLRMQRGQAVVPPAEAPAPVPERPAVVEPTPPTLPATPPAPVPELVPARPAQHLEAVIGQKWIGWIAVVLIFGAASFFLKYAFDNHWIGNLGRVAIGVIAGLAFAWAGFDRHRKGWRYLSQVLTGGGVVILYLSVYSAFGYYHLVDQRTAFVFLVILVAEAHLLAMAYDARSIAIMALVGGFLAPILLSTGRDQYRVLFSYIGVLDLGMLGVVMARRWRWIGSLAYVGTQVLFWGWYGEHYHPEKRAAALTFQAVIFVLFMLADLAPHLRRRAAGWEEWIRLAVNPFVFYATCYFLLNDDHHDWMAPLALGVAIVYAWLAKAELALHAPDRRMLLVTVGTALTFVTVAIPIQLEAHWITIAWGLEAVALLWAGFETSAPPLRLMSGLVMSLAVFRYLVADIPWMRRLRFFPVFNRFFLGTLALTACLAGAAYLWRRWRPGADGLRPRLFFGMMAVGILWLGSSVEAYTYYAALARAAEATVTAEGVEAAKSLRWSGQLALSVLWSVFAGTMTAVGFRLQLRAWRVAGLTLFGLTLVKVVFMDIAELEQFYRIVALLALGVVLLAVAWGYQRAVRREQAS